MIITGWYEKILWPKILVPWDSPGVNGASIFLGPRSMSMPMSNSGYLGSIWTPCGSGIPDYCQKSKNDRSLVWTRYVGRQFATLKSIANDGKPFTIGDSCVNRKKSQKSLYYRIWALKSVRRHFNDPKSVRRFFSKKILLKLVET